MIDRLLGDIETFLRPLAKAVRHLPWDDARKAAQNLYVIARDHMKVPEDWDVMVELAVIGDVNWRPKS